MKPTDSAKLLIRFVEWLASATDWRVRLRKYDIAKEIYATHARHVAKWAKEAFTKWRAVTFP